jgi:hypothetical protein
MCELYLSGYRVIVGFEKLSDAQDFQAALSQAQHAVKQPVDAIYPDDIYALIDRTEHAIAKNSEGQKTFDGCIVSGDYYTVFKEFLYQASQAQHVKSDAGLEVLEKALEWYAKGNHLGMNEHCRDYGTYAEKALAAYRKNQPKEGIE